MGSMKALKTEDVGSVVLYRAKVEVGHCPCLGQLRRNEGIGIALRLSHRKAGPRLKTCISSGMDGMTVEGRFMWLAPR